MGHRARLTLGPSEGAAEWGWRLSGTCTRERASPRLPGKADGEAGTWGPHEGPGRTQSLGESVTAWTLRTLPSWCVCPVCPLPLPLGKGQSLQVDGKLPQTPTREDRRTAGKAVSGRGSRFPSPALVMARRCSCRPAPPAPAAPGEPMGAPRTASRPPLSTSALSPLRARQGNEAHLCHSPQGGGIFTAFPEERSVSPPWVLLSRFGKMNL